MFPQLTHLEVSFSCKEIWTKPSFSSHWEFALRVSQETTVSIFQISDEKNTTLPHPKNFHHANKVTLCFSVLLVFYAALPVRCLGKGFQIATCSVSSPSGEETLCSHTQGAANWGEFAFGNGNVWLCAGSTNISVTQERFALNSAPSWVCCLSSICCLLGIALYWYHSRCASYLTLRCS